MNRTHLFPRNLGGPDRRNNLVTAYAADNQIRIRNVERRIEELADTHRSVCVVIIPHYRQTAEEGTLLVPKMLSYHVVTSKDNGEVEYYHPLVVLRRLKGLRKKWWGIDWEIFPLN